MSASRSPAPPTLDDMLCLALHAAARAMTARYRPALKPLGLTYPQYLVMVLLWQEGSSSVGRIGARLGLESSTLSPLLKRLEAMGLVSRTRSKADERSVLIELTERGSAMRAQTAGVPAQIGSASRLNSTEQAELVSSLRELADALDQSTATTRT